MILILLKSGVEFGFAYPIEIEYDELVDGIMFIRGKRVVTFYFDEIDSITGE